MESLQPAVHGGPDYAELEALGIAPEEVLDFSVCSNPFGPPPGVRAAMSSVACDRYPDSEATALRRALSAKLGVSPESILVGSGSTELIRLAALTYLRPQDTALILAPTFGEYEVACRLAGGQIIRQVARTEAAFQLEISESLDLIREQRPRAVFLCQPNNPTGQYLERHEVETLLQAAPESLVVMDEAYIAFVDDAWPSLDLLRYDNLLVLRSMTKDYALAGLRLGYAVASPQVIAHLRRARPPWNVNAVAQQAGRLALREEAWLNRCREQLRQAGDSLRRELAGLGLSVLPSRAHFFLVRVGDAGQFRRAMLKRRILVRDGSSFGLPEYVRIAPRTISECQKLVQAVAEWREHGRRA